VGSNPTPAALVGAPDPASQAGFRPTDSLSSFRLVGRLRRPWTAVSGCSLARGADRSPWV